MVDDIITHNKKIIMFGCGAIGTTTAVEILNDYNLCNNIDCFIDNSALLWGTEIKTTQGRYTVNTPLYLEQCTPLDTVIVLNISRYSDVLEQLESMPCTKYMNCYITPMMCIHNFRPKGNQGVIKKYSESKIPKIIHYMWLGGKTLPDNLHKCIDSWKKYCPDYEIKCWNEDNYDISKNLYMKQAYDNKAYGFVPDYARLDILYKYGGIYLDTDVELKRNIDGLLYQDAFCGVEKWQLVNAGGSIGSVPGNQIIKKLIDNREHLSFINLDGTLNRNTCGFYDTAVLIENGYKINGKIQRISGMTVYTWDYFHPYDYMSGKCEMTDDTFSVHHFNGGWLTDEQRMINKECSAKYDKLYNEVRSLKWKIY